MTESERKLTEQEENLKKLFKEWMKKHKEEPKESHQFTFPKSKIPTRKDFFESFCYDGFLAPPTAERKTILFVCREANIAKGHIFNGELTPETTRTGNCFGQFWMKEQLDINASNPYTKFVRKITARYQNHNGCDYNLAYMNLNKRGGVSTCNATRLKCYVEQYKDSICQELEIIAPDIIICGGSFGIISPLLPDLEKKLQKKIECRDCYHPHYIQTHPGKCEKDYNAINQHVGNHTKLND